MEAESLKPIDHGNTADIYEYEDGKILKLFREYMPIEAIEGEYHNSCAVQELLDCVPMTYDLIENDGRFGIVYQRIIGTDMMKMIFSSLGTLSHRSKELARIHHQMHVKIEMSTIEHEKKQLPSVKEKLSEDLKHVNQLTQTKKQQIINYLNTLPDGNKLCHFDFHPGNIIYAEEKPIIIDWMTACYGDPLSDVARTCVMLNYAVIPGMHGIMKLLADIFKKIILKLYLKEYMKLSGCTISDIKKWYPPIIAARLRESVPDAEKKRLLKILHHLVG